MEQRVRFLLEKRGYNKQKLKNENRKFNNHPEARNTLLVTQQSLKRILDAEGDEDEKWIYYNSPDYRENVDNAMSVSGFIKKKEEDGFLPRVLSAKGPPNPLQKNLTPQKKVPPTNSPRKSPIAPTDEIIAQRMEDSFFSNLAALKEITPKKTTPSRRNNTPLTALQTPTRNFPFLSIIPPDAGIVAAQNDPKNVAQVSEFLELVQPKRANSVSNSPRNTTEEKKPSKYKEIQKAVEVGLQKAFEPNTKRTTRGAQKQKQQQATDDIIDEWYGLVDDFYNGEIKKATFLDKRANLKARMQKLGGSFPKDITDDQYFIMQ